MEAAFKGLQSDKRQEKRTTNEQQPPPPRLSRLLHLLRLLGSGIERNADDYAQILNVSRRTVFRDLESLEEAGVQIEYHSSLKVYRLRAPVRLKLQSSFQDSLSMAISLAALKRFSVSEASAAALAYIETTLSEALSPVSYDSFQLARRFISWQAAPTPDPIAKKHLEDLFHGFTSGTRVRLTIHSDRGHQGTLFSPKKLVVGDGVIHVLGWSTFHRRCIQINLRDIRTTEPTNDPIDGSDFGHQG